MTAEAFLDEDLPSAEAFLDAAEPAPSMSAEAFLDTPLDEEPPAAEPVPTPFEERPTGMVALDLVPQAKPSPLPSPAEEQTASLSRDALADANAKRGIFSPDSAPYRLIGEQFAIDPLRYDEAAGALWKDGLIDSDQYYRMMNDAAEIKPAAQRRRALETQAGTNPELKAALYGLTKGAIQTAGAIGVGGAAGAALAPTGPGAIVGGIAAGTGTAMVLGDMVDTFAEKLAQENETIASLLAAKELYPGYDTAGQLASVLIPAPSAVSKLKTAASLIATERGAGEAAKFVARVTGTGAGIGAATDLAVQGGMAGVNLATGNPVDFSMESLAVSTALGGLTAGLGVRSQNKIYKPEELVGLERRALDGTASFEEFRDYSTMRAAVETLRKDDRLLSADAVRRATADFMGTPALDVTEIINPRFQQQALADAGLVLPYAAAPTAAPVAGAPVAYTGQAFLDRGGPAPAFQGGTNALPGPEGIPALPGPLPETPVASVKESLPVPAPAPLPEPPTALAAPSRLYLNVPFNRKEAAKSVGAKFDPDKKLWYLPRQASGEFAPISQGFVPTAFDSSRSPKDLEAARINAEAEFGRPVEIASAKISSGTTAYALKFKGGDWLNKAINFEIEREQARVKNNFSGGGTVPATMESQPSAPAPLPESPTESTLLEAPIVEFPVANLKLSKDVPNFKENADPQTGVVKGEALQGKVDRRGMAPIVAWRRLNGDVEVISGRHRLDLFRRNQVGTIPTQIFNEADGFTIQDALTLDAELNIRDGQGTIKDYADYFRNSDIGEQQATERGLLSRQKGISGFAIGKGGSDDLYAAFSAGKLSESKAAAIALAAPGDAEMQRVGMQFAKELSAPELTSFIAVNRRAKQPGAKQGDLFGNSDDNLNAAVALVKASRKRIQDLDNQILSVKGAVKRPEAARKMGVDVNDPEAIRTRMVELEAQKEKYIRFFDHPEILAEVRALAFGEAAPIKPPTIATNGEGNLIAEGEMPFNLTSEPEPTPVAIEPVDEEAARRAAIRKAGEESTMSLFDAGPLPAAKAKGKSSGYADAGPLPAPAPAAAPAAKPDMATYSDAQIYADYPEAVGVVRTKGPGWTMPLILGGTDKVPVMEMPEIVEFYRSLVGQDPSVRNLRSLGLFNPASGNVSIRPDIFQNEQSALMTLAHEIGHVVSWMDERDIRLGNLGGHIMNVQKFLKTAFPIERGGEFITPQERKKLYAQARNSMPKGSKPEKDDPGRGDWEMEVASRYRELIQELMTERGLAYVGPRRGDFEAGAYDPNIREELIGLSEWWKPIDYDRAPDSYLKYRHSAVELYADAVSVLFNSPADLEQRAPNFWKAFWNYADARPQVKASLFEIQNRIQNGREAVLDKRLERDLASFKAGRETFLRKHNAAQERRRSLTGWWESFKDQYWNRYQPLIESAAKARAAGKITPAEEDAYRWLTEEHPLADGKLQLHLADIGRLYQKLDEAGISRDLLGLSLKYHRIANERLDVMQEIDGEMVKVGETGRAVMANPGGETARTAAEMLAKLRASMSPEQAAALDETLSGFRAVVFSVMEDANASGMFSPQLWETISNNRENYAAFTPLEYVEEYLPSAIKKQIGTFKEIADPLQQTVLKMISIHRAAQNNRFKRGVADMLREVAPELITDAPMKYNGKAMVPQPPRDSELALLQWKDGGQLHGVHIPKRYAAMFEDKSPAERDAILRFLATGFQRAVYGAIIRYNPAFQLFMSPARDLQRSLTNMPGGVKGRAKFLANLFNPEAWGASVDWARGDIGRSALLREMVENAAVGGPHSAFGGKLQGDDDALVAILRKFHLQDQPARNALLRAVMKPLHAIEFAGQVLQLLPKAAAYKVMVKDTGMAAPQAANTIRNHIGIPNYYKKGRNVSSAGALVPFLNIFLRSYESLYRNLSGKERNMGGKEWWIAWALTGGGLYAVMQTLAREGVFGEDLQRLYSRVSNYDMTNYGILPLGEVSTGDTGGKTAYLRLPQDEGLRVINGTVAKLLQSSIRTAKGDPTAPNIGDVFDGISSQVPGVNPVVEVAQVWKSFLSGDMPRDNFRNKNILTEDQWLAGGWDALKPMMGWTLGATGITNFFNYDPKAETFTEMTISATPVLNRLLKISDQGIYENQKAEDQAAARVMAKARLTLPDFVQGLRAEFNYLKNLGERRSERQEERYSELLLWNRSYREAWSEFETSMELGNRPAARDAIQTLIQESRDYRPAN